MIKSEKLKHKALKPVKRHQELSFAEYALKATENLPKEFQGRSFYYTMYNDREVIRQSLLLNY